MTDPDRLPSDAPVGPDEHQSSRPVRTAHAKEPAHPDDDDLAERAAEEEEDLGVADS